jgi:hypothetical protein
LPTSKLSYALPVTLAACHAQRERRLLGADGIYSVLDVGPGRGKYGLILREYLAAPVRIDAVELEPRYCTERLRAIYDSVLVNDARYLHREFLDRYDLVVMVDVIEHFTLEEGQALLGRVSGAVIITTPTVYFQNPEAEEGWPTEEHKSLWRLADFPASRVRCAELLPEEGLLVCLYPK